MNIAINGFGRIGRQALRIIQENPEKFSDLNVVLINDLTDGATMAHLYEFDSNYGHFECGGACFRDGLLCTKSGKIRLSAEKDPAALAHKELKVDVVLECTGRFTKRDDAALHLKAGAKKVIVSAPCSDKADVTLCMGVNEATYDPKKMDVISNSSCTTNCLAPMAKVLHDTFGIEHGLMTTIHSYTNDQQLLDLSHKDLRRARAAAINMIPTSTGAAKVIGLVIPELEGKLHGQAIRVPTPTVSITDLTVVVSKAKVTAEVVNMAFEAAAEKKLRGILFFETRPLVSRDFIANSHSCILDSAMTQVIGGNLVKVCGWYDNEWGYSSRLVEMTQYVGRKL